jgi:hypothetical protein
MQQVKVLEHSIENNAITCAATWLRGRKLTRASFVLSISMYFITASASHVKLSWLNMAALGLPTVPDCN